MPRLSFVIPVVNEAAGIAELLQRLARDFPGAERVVVDGGSRDDSVSEALRHADLVLMSEPGRALQMNLGAAAARGDILCFLHADTWPCFDANALHAQTDSDFRWGFCRVRLRGNSGALRVIAASMNRRSRWTRVATGDQLLVVARDFFAQNGGFAEIPLMEDVEISKRLRALAPPRAFPLHVSSSGRRWEQRGVVRTVLLMWALRLAYWAGVSPQRLWRYYYGGVAVPDGAG